MDRYLLDGQEKCLKDEAELEKALKHYEDTDRWYFPRANEIYAKGVDNTPLFYGDYMRSISATCSEELFEECVKSTGIFLKVPDTILKDGYNTFAVREIALESVLERAGVACRLMRTLTDTGCVTDEIREAIAGSDLLVIEANHEKNILLYGRYPYSVKHRILSDKGHLSNEDAAYCISEYLSTVKPGVVPRVLLAHISKENNTPVQAKLTVSNILQEEGYYVGRDLMLDTLDKNSMTNPIYL